MRLMGTACQDCTASLHRLYSELNQCQVRCVMSCCTLILLVMPPVPDHSGVTGSVWEMSPHGGNYWGVGEQNLSGGGQNAPTPSYLMVTLLDGDIQSRRNQVGTCTGQVQATICFSWGLDIHIISIEMNS